MKKYSILLLVSLTVTLALTGCGKDKEKDAESKETPAPVESTAPAPEENDTQDTEQVKSDEPPEEGMVRSVMTNEWISPEAASARPIAVMFPTDKGSQPQYGIGSAGVLYECMEEGEMSRQMGVIEQWQDLKQIGNIRSGRDYYVYWSQEWDAFYIHWGGPFYLREMVDRSDVDNLSAASVGVPGNSSPALGSEAFYRSDPKNPTIHNGYTNGEKLTAAISALGYETEHREKYYHPDHFTFATVSEPNTLEDAPGVFDAKKIDFSKIFTTTKTSLEYNEEEGVYYKSLYGQPQIDKLTDKQLSFDNVIVQSTYWDYRQDNKYLRFNVKDTTSDGYYFTKGKGIHITWKKSSDNEPTKYYDDNGNEIVLNTGKTFIGIAQNGRQIIYE